MEWYTLNFRKLVVSRDRKMGVRSGGETERKELVNDKGDSLMFILFWSSNNGIFGDIIY
jgi:hypothetical protein